MDHVRYLRLTASLKDYRGKTAKAEAVAAAVHTPFNLHLHLATSTHFPKVRTRRERWKMVGMVAKMTSGYRGSEKMCD